MDNFLLEEMVVARLFVPMGAGHVIAGVKRMSSTGSRTVKQSIQPRNGRSR